ncbi:MAG: hypothetical protein ABI972_03330 [Acidobacteriota bacterium]
MELPINNTAHTRLEQPNTRNHAPHVFFNSATSHRFNDLAQVRRQTGS